MGLGRVGTVADHGRLEPFDLAVRTVQVPAGEAGDAEHEHRGVIGAADPNADGAAVHVVLEHLDRAGAGQRGHGVGLPVAALVDLDLAEGLHHARALALAPADLVAHLGQCLGLGRGLLGLVHEVVAGGEALLEHWDALGQGGGRP